MACGGVRWDASHGRRPQRRPGDNMPVGLLWEASATLGHLWLASLTDGPVPARRSGEAHITEVGVKGMCSAWLYELTDDGQGLLAAVDGMDGQGLPAAVDGMSHSTSSVVEQEPAGEFARVLAAEAWGIVFPNEQPAGQMMLWPDALPSSCTTVGVANSWPMTLVDIGTNKGAEELQ